MPTSSGLLYTDATRHRARAPRAVSLIILTTEYDARDTDGAARWSPVSPRHPRPRSVRSITGCHRQALCWCVAAAITCGH